MITECSMSDNVSAEFPEIEFVRSCTICPHMKKITLERVLESLEETTVRDRRSSPRSPPGRCARSSG